MDSNLEALSGLKINFGKSEIFLIGGRENVEALTAELGCKAETLPTTTWRGPHKLVRIWDPIEKRFRTRLAIW